MPPPLPIRNNDSTAEHYVDGPIGVNFLNGNLHITFVTVRADHAAGADPAPPYRQDTMRLIMPLAGAIDLQANISAIRTTLQGQGLVQPVMPGPPTKQ